MKHIRKVIEIDEELCNGCGDCVPSCEEGAIQIIDGKAKLVADKYCDGLGACLGECPTGALKVVEREADDFNEAAVAEHLKAQQPAKQETPKFTCPGARLQSLSTSAAPCASADTPAPSAPAPSALSHWPVQIRLVPPSAPFLQGASLLVAADCVPVAYPNFHQDLLSGKVVMVGCPKFDDLDLYQQRFEDIFAQNNVRDVTAVVMEVPCCQGLPVVVHNAIAKSGKNVPFEKVTVSLQGEIIHREKH